MKTTATRPILQKQNKPTSSANIFTTILPDRPLHEANMRLAFEQATYALTIDETPVGCVLVHGPSQNVIGQGYNDTNRSLNGTRHAEFVAIEGILKKHPVSVLRETDLYVTVEPCVMCAAALRMWRIRTVYFGCANERFGGVGGVLRVNEGPSIDPPYPVYGGIFREEAIMLLRRFYVQENDKAPNPKEKKNRELKTEILPLNVGEPAAV